MKNTILYTKKKYLIDKITNIANMFFNNVKVRKWEVSYEKKLRKKYFVEIYLLWIVFICNLKAK